MTRTINWGLGLLIPSLIILHLVCAPYTKVEESFALQATHDILQFGLPSLKSTKNGAASYLQSYYDHFSFPGAVPRTFVGPLLLAALSKIGVHDGGLKAQIIVRGTLGLLNAAALLWYSRSLAKSTLGNSTASWFILIQACQFHVMYYASRTLPNMFAFALTTIAFERLLPVPSAMIDERIARSRRRIAIYLLTITAVVYRAEIAVLLAAQTAYLLLRGQLSVLNDILPAGLLGGVMGLLITVPIDSFFWQKWPLWPELAGFLYNAIEGQSTAWGTSPWHFYFTNALPRLLMNPMMWQVCIPFALSVRTTRQASINLLVPSLLFVGIYSILPHKEWRFIIYILPGLNTVAAFGANWIWTRRAKSFAYQFLSIALIGSVLASFAASMGFLIISGLNYPGAVAIRQLHKAGSGLQPEISVHMDTLSCVSGVTRFLQRDDVAALNDRPTVWKYDKTEDENTLLDPNFWQQFDYALAEKPERVIGKWEVIETIDGFGGIGLEQIHDREEAKLSRGGVPSLQRSLDWIHSLLPTQISNGVLQGRWIRIEMSPRIHILKRQTHPPPLEL